MSEEADREAGPFALWLRRVVGWLLGAYLRFVHATSRVTYDPPDFWDRIDKDWPVLFTAWHGQCNLIYPTSPDPRRIAKSLHPWGRNSGPGTSPHCHHHRSRRM